jgi:hypothetical protein
VQGNEHADRLAKTALSFPDRPPLVFTPDSPEWVVHIEGATLEGGVCKDVRRRKFEDYCAQFFDEYFCRQADHGHDPECTLLHVLPSSISWSVSTEVPVRHEIRQHKTFDFMTQAWSDKLGDKKFMRMIYASTLDQYAGLQPMTVEPPESDSDEPEPDSPPPSPVMDLPFVPAVQPPDKRPRRSEGPLLFYPTPLTPPPIVLPPAAQPRAPPFVSMRTADMTEEQKAAKRRGKRSVHAPNTPPLMPPPPPPPTPPATPPPIASPLFLPATLPMTPLPPMSQPPSPTAPAPAISLDSVQPAPPPCQHLRLYAKCRDGRCSHKCKSCEWQRGDFVPVQQRQKRPNEPADNPKRAKIARLAEATSATRKRMLSKSRPAAPKRQKTSPETTRKKETKREMRMHRVAATYTDDLCERCRQIMPTVETRRHMLVDCPANEPVLRSLQISLMNIVQAAVHTPVRSIPNWFGVTNSQICNNLDSQVHLELGRYDKVAGMIGMFPKLAKEWLSNTFAMPSAQRVLVAKRMNLCIIRASMSIMRARNASLNRAYPTRLARVRALYSPKKKRKRKPG